MRVWDFSPSILCRSHLLAQHREIHTIWTIIHGTKKNGYWYHPEVKRWIGYSLALYNKHEETVEEFSNRGYNHFTPLGEPTPGSSGTPQNGQSILEQKEILRDKGCSCNWGQIQV